MKVNSTGDSFVVDSAQTNVRFTWRGDTLTQIDDCLIGLCDSTNEWYYMGDYDIQYTVNNDKVATLPTDAESSPMKLEYIPDAANLDSVTSTIINAWGSDTYETSVWLDHLESNLPDAPIVGYANPTDFTVSFASKQYLGVDETYNSHIYALSGNAKVEVDTTYEETYFNYDLTSALKLKMFSTPTSEDPDTVGATYPASLIINCGRNNLYIVAEYVAPRLIEWEDKALTPADPIFTSENVRYSTNFDVLKFIIPTVSTDSAELNTNNLYYNVYYNDSVYVFTPDLYEGLSANMTDVPYDFTDENYDFYPYGGYQTIYFYDNNWSKIGVQSIYRGGGEEHRSNVVWVSNTSSVSNVSAAKTVARVTYYNLAGCQVSESTTGLVIKQVTYTDGTSSVAKIVK